MVGYSGQNLAEDAFLAWGPWVRIDPEMRRRLKAMMDASIDAGHPCGIGGSWRSTATQTQLFLSRYTVDHDGNYYGDIFWNGNWYAKNPGVAPAAPPGQSYHESTTAQGCCLAVDMVGDLTWCHTNEAKFGLLSFGAINGESWHFQPSEIPHARPFYNSSYEPLKVFPIAGTTPTPPPPPAPTPVIVPAPVIKLTSPYTNGKNVMMLQSIMAFWGWSKSPADGWAGPVTIQGIKVMQTALKVVSDGVYGPQTAAAYKAFAEAMQSIAS
jgi:hypothetical protein